MKIMTGYLLRYLSWSSFPGNLNSILKTIYLWYFIYILFLDAVFLPIFPQVFDILVILLKFNMHHWPNHDLPKPRAPTG